MDVRMMLRRLREETKGKRNGGDGTEGTTSSYNSGDATSTSAGRDMTIVSSQDSCRDIGGLQERYVNVEGIPFPIKLLEDPLAKWSSGNGATLWDAAIVLTLFLLLEVCGDNSDDCHKLVVVELGAGLGLPGIALFTQGHTVYSTERPLAFELLQTNIQLNIAHTTAHESCTPGIICAVPLEWDSFEGKLPIDDWDIVIGSDLIFPNNEECWTALVDVWDQLLTSPVRCMPRRGYLSYEERSDDVIIKFQALLKARNISCDRSYSSKFNIPSDIRVYMLVKNTVDISSNDAPIHGS